MPASAQTRASASRSALPQLAWLAKQSYKRHTCLARDLYFCSNPRNTPKSLWALVSLQAGMPLEQVIPLALGGALIGIIKALFFWAAPTKPKPPHHRDIRIGPASYLAG